MTEVREYKGVKIGLPADRLLVKFPGSGMVMEPKVVGRDEDGLVVEWHYRDVIFTLARARDGDFEMYAVQRIMVRDEQDTN